MKRLLILTIILCGSGYNALLHAQESKLCGDWQGYYDTLVPDDNWDMVPLSMKMYVRIKTHGNEMTIRVKNCPVKDQSKIKYWNECKIVNKTSSSIEFTSLVNSVNEQWRDIETERVNGQVVYSWAVWYVCSAKLSQEKLYMSYHLHYEYYGKNGNIIGTNNGSTDNVILYQEEDDW